MQLLRRPDMNKCSRNQAAMPTIASDAERNNRRRDHETLCSVDRGSAFGLTAGGADDKHDNVNGPAGANVDQYNLVDQDDDGPCSFDRPSRPGPASCDEASSSRRPLQLPSASRQASHNGQEDDEHHHQELD
jgi:hypothetical protein